MTVPTYVTELVNQDDKNRLLQLFQTQFRGRPNARKKRDFLKALYGNSVAGDESYNNSHDRAFRLMVDALIEEGYPICSTSGDGYWWAESLTDGMASVKEGHKRATSIHERASKLEENLLSHFGGQLEFGM